MESEPNEREWELAQAALNQYVGADKPGSFGVDDKFLGIIRGLLASYRAELTAPAGGDDREAAEALANEISGVILKTLPGDRWYMIRDKAEAALRAARGKGEAIKTAELEFVRTTGLLVADYATMGKATPERQEQYILARDTLAALVRCEKEVESGEHIKS